LLVAIGELSSHPAAACASDGYTYWVGGGLNRASHGSRRASAGMSQ
jgi:hypothetical protein